MNEANEVQKIAAFWDWFAKNEASFRTLTAANRDELLDSIFAEIHRIDEGLGCEVGGKNNPPDLIIVAFCRTELFLLVDRIVAAAPPLGDWVVKALAPARGFEFKMEWEGVPIQCDELVFNPLQSASMPDSLGIALFLPDALFEIEGAPYQAAYRILETALGERTVSQKIQHVQAERLDGKDLNEFIPVLEMEEYITLHDQKHRR